MLTRDVVRIGCQLTKTQSRHASQKTASATVTPENQTASSILAFPPTSHIFVHVLQVDLDVEFGKPICVESSEQISAVRNIVFGVRSWKATQGLLGYFGLWQRRWVGGQLYR